MKLTEYLKHHSNLSEIPFHKLEIKIYTPTNTLTLNLTDLAEGEITLQEGQKLTLDTELEILTVEIP
jgi:hypothetical protein